MPRTDVPGTPPPSPAAPQMPMGDMGRIDRGGMSGTPPWMQMPSSPPSMLGLGKPMQPMGGGLPSIPNAQPMQPPGMDSRTDSFHSSMLGLGSGGPAPVSAGDGSMCAGDQRAALAQLLAGGSRRYGRYGRR